MARIRCRTGCRNTHILTLCWCTATNLGCRPVDHRFEETRWESFEADILVGIVRRDLHQVVRSVWVNLNGVIPASRLIQDLPDRTHIRFDTLSGYRGSWQEQSAGEGGSLFLARDRIGIKPQTTFQAYQARRLRGRQPWAFKARLLGP